ncbi:hypothetical protein L1049_016735 [Liquidambar formosana]|uniref:Pectinesterase inhibitor domain-containing protein n=1 Tax=Liquidambar formosana TaxID=63359 RepID=A0AAP0S1K4_LIQFO
MGSARLSVEAKNPLIDKICGRTGNGSFCESVLSVDPRLEGADLKSIAVYFTGTETVNFTDTFQAVNSLRDNATDPKMKQVLTYCSQIYKVALDSIDASTRFAMSLNCTALIDEVQNPPEVANTCEYEFKVTPLPSPLTQRNQICEALGNIMVAIAHLLCP